MIFFDSIYKQGYEAGVNATKLQKQEDQNRRLEDMLKYGKEIGRTDGYRDGYMEGYKCGYVEGEADTRAREGIVEISGEEFDALVDDVTEAEEAV